MNNTERAQRDMAEKMLKVQIDVNEVADMSGLPLEVVQAMKDELEKKNPETAAFRNLDITDMDLGPVMYDEN